MANNSTLAKDNQRRWAHGFLLKERPLKRSKASAKSRAAKCVTVSVSVWKGAAQAGRSELATFRKFRRDTARSMKQNKGTVEVTIEA